MEKIVISEEMKGDYKKLIQTAQQVEAAVGGAYCKLNKMVEVRRQVDTDLKTWWDKVAEEYKIDKSKDYYVDQDGAINVVERPAQPAPEGAQDGGASEAKTEESDQGANPEGQAEEVVPEGKTEEVTEDVDNKEGGTVEDLK